ncbi:MAG TPA: GDP-mannose 4,6-dehydratase [Gemmatales bacterium]|nr:GDP-mannose 4,6-dehydratase [Gemmatales bacterium]HMP58724.1 GDP-mannose 4,6-dehydratase [Gemmatales bacterium]
MKVLVTGAAGFIGSHLCERLLHLGHDVVGLDAYIPYYAREIKEANLASCQRHPRFRFRLLDLRTDNLDGSVMDADVVVHLAAMPGLMRSWTDFDLYVGCNIQATQRLLEAVRRQGTLQRFILGSTSSVYGRFASGDETLPTRPVSPYGVTKLAAEHLCKSYAESGDLPLVILRFFSVYGPRQRPDMAYNRFVAAMLAGEPIQVYGDGQQVRGNTYVLDCVAAITAAFEAQLGETYNVGGGEAVSVLEVIERLEKLSGLKAHLRMAPVPPGDQRHTFADTTKLRRHVNWQPHVHLDEGLRRQWHWQEQLFHRRGKRAA